MYSLFMEYVRTNSPNIILPKRGVSIPLTSLSVRHQLIQLHCNSASIKSKVVYIRKLTLK